MHIPCKENIDSSSENGYIVQMKYCLNYNVVVYQECVTNQTNEHERRHQCLVLVHCVHKMYNQKKVRGYMLCVQL